LRHVFVDTMEMGHGGPGKSRYRPVAGFGDKAFKPENRAVYIGKMSVITEGLK